MARQHGDVVTPLAQSRQAQADDVQAMEQVFTKRTVFNALLQILMRGSNHTDIGFDRRVAAHAVEVTIAQHTQQAGLQIERHVANLIEKQRAAIGLLKAATSHGLRTGEGPALVAEQLAFQQVFGNGSGVDGDEGPVGSLGAHVATR